MPLRDDLLKPIPGDNPSGINLRYDPITDKIKEARREDLDVPQGDWKTALKTADYGFVIKAGSEAIATRGKDLQIAVWLVEAHVRREGFEVLAPSFGFLRELLEQFWDTLYPPIEDDDYELRAAPLDWLGTKLPEALAAVPITSGGMTPLNHKESRIIGYEADADTYEKQEARRARVEEGKITAEQFDEAIDATPREFLVGRIDALHEALEALEPLVESCDARFGDVSPSFIKTRNTLEEIEQTLRIFLAKKPEEAVEPEPEPSTESEAAPETEPEPQAAFEQAEEPAAVPEETPAWPEETPEPEPSASMSVEPSDTEDAAQRLAVICRFLRQQNPADASPYLILRGFRWGELRNNAPPVDTGVLAAPPTEFRVELKSHANNGEWDQVLETAENAMADACGRAWLDPQRYAFTALEQMGYSSAAAAVRSALRGLLEDLPELLDLTLPDDMPAANAETREWIESVVMKPARDEASAAQEAASAYFQEESSPAEAGIPELPPVEERPPILEPAEPESAPEPEPGVPPDEFQAAFAAVRDGRTSEGLSILTGALAAERCGRGRFRRRTQLAHLLMAAGQRKVAQALLDQLAAEIEERRLEEWEQGEVLAYPLELLLRCLGQDDEQRRTELYTRLCKLDPVRAVNCSF